MTLLTFLLGIWVGAAWGYLVGMGRWRNQDPKKAGEHDAP